MPGNIGGDLQSLRELYESRWTQYGRTPLSLGWTKGKQDIRFSMLLDGLSVEGSRFLDIGCGFGDINQVLKTRAQQYTYLGVDLVPTFVQEATESYGSSSTKFAVCDFYSESLQWEGEYVVASGIFGFQMHEIDNYDYIKTMLEKMLAVASEAVAVDFLSDRVNFRRENTFYADPCRVLEIALSLTRCVKVRHDYMPFEFALTLFKDDSFSDSDTVFSRYKRYARQDNRLHQEKPRFDHRGGGLSK